MCVSLRKEDKRNYKTCNKQSAAASGYVHVCE